MENIKEGLAQLLSVLETIRVVDILDIAIVAYLIYKLITLIRKTRAAQLVKGILLLFVISFLASNLQMRTLSNILSAVLQFGVLALVIVFQPEIRRVLEQMGRTNIISFDSLRNRSESEERCIRTTRAIAVVCDAVEQMSNSRTGALIVFERRSNLSEVLTTGTMVNGDVTIEMLNTIFYEGTLLHDGAVVIRDGRIAAGGCVLPLSENLEISKEMGTRHRAALGMSESSDAVVVVVSEESGIVSLAKKGVLIRRLDRAALYKILTDDLLPLVEPTEKEKAKARKKQARAARRAGRPAEDEAASATEKETEKLPAAVDTSADEEQKSARLAAILRFRRSRGEQKENGGAVKKAGTPTEDSETKPQAAKKAKTPGAEEIGRSAAASGAKAGKTKKSAGEAAPEQAPEGRSEP